MISGSREKDFCTKQEGGFDLGENTKRLYTSRTWSVLKNPRIVRVSRSLGKKDRHSKVSTVRGLRDRRVRLSVQTAIQLYDLQDRLGLNQPSKVVDWLLNAAQTEISELPPLPMQQENCIQNPQSIPSTSRLDKNLDCFKDRGVHSFNSDGILMAKSKYAQNPFSVLNNSSNTISVSNAFPSNSWDSSNAFVSHLGSHGFPFQVEELQIPNAIQIPSSLSISSGSQLNLLPNISNPLEFDSKQVDYSQILSRNSQNPLPTSLFTSLYSVNPAMRPFPGNMNQKNTQEIQAKILQKGFSSSSIPNDSRLIHGSNTSSIHVQMCEANEENL